MGSQFNNKTNLLTQIPGKGHNKTLEIANPVEHTRAANGVIRGHVPENGGTCGSLSQFAFSFNVTVCYWLFYRIVKECCQHVSKLSENVLIVIFSTEAVTYSSMPSIRFSLIF
jgi:hypothetical protein